MIIFQKLAEKDRGGDFEKGYEHFYNSLKYCPNEGSTSSRGAVTLVHRPHRRKIASR
jgi:hypothetical protein